ncbi:MAG: hypothetical protein ABTQ28_21540, partial [Thauera sp.]
MSLCLIPMGIALAQSGRGAMRIPQRRLWRAALILLSCAADGRQHHALAAPVFKAATRFAA